MSLFAILLVCLSTISAVQSLFNQVSPARHTTLRAAANNEVIFPPTPTELAKKFFASSAVAALTGNGLDNLREIGMAALAQADTPSGKNEAWR